ncbi:MAG: hypothetical protein U0802_22050 [Candidatus Binatia bacterium]
MLLGMARLAAVEASLAEGRLLVLDAWPAAAPRPPLPEGRAREAFYDALAAHGALLARAVAATASATTPAARRATRASSPRSTGSPASPRRAAAAPTRLAPEPLLPARPARRRDLVVALPPPGAAATQWQAARTAVAVERERVAAWRGYELVTRNCVTELFALVDGVPGGQPAALGAAVARAPWNAIPFVAADAVAAAPRVVGSETWPSFRQAARQRHLARDPGLATWLAETTAATAEGYRPGADDSTFLFFTDGAPALRPLLGAANLAAAGANGVLGLVTWPADGGRRLQAGARGALYSLPELAFVNIRKGTTAWLFPDELPAP